MEHFRSKMRNLTAIKIVIISTFMLFAGTVHGQGDGSWSTNASAYRGRFGQRVVVKCPPTRALPPIWGTDVYTDDSSICSAGVHAGAITAENGGTVTVEIRNGESAYRGSIRNKVESFGYGEWEGSFAVLVPTKRNSDSTNGANYLIRRRADWKSTIAEFRGRIGTRILVSCPATERLTGGVWGSEVYADDSSVCLAAVHAGVMTASGGNVLVEIRAGMRNYFGTASNGITSHSYGAWDGSFVVLPESTRDVVAGKDCTFTTSSSTAEVQARGIAKYRF